jgi:predicted small metal-binding protein
MGYSVPRAPERLRSQSLASEHQGFAKLRATPRRQDHAQQGTVAAREDEMTKVIQCPCGTVIRAGDDDKLVAQAQRHAKDVHAMELTREQALAMASPE